MRAVRARELRGMLGEAIKRTPSRREARAMRKAYNEAGQHKSLTPTRYRRQKGSPRRWPSTKYNAKKA